MNLFPEKEGKVKPNIVGGKGKDNKEGGVSVVAHLRKKMRFKWKAVIELRKKLQLS